MLRSRYASVLLTAVMLCFAFSTVPFNDGLKQILDKLSAYVHYRPQEKLYLHLDKPFYAAGEDLWFKAYLVNASFHTGDSASRVIYAELLDAHGKLIQRDLLYVSGGLARGDFSLPDSLAEGRYVIRAYTNYMKNQGEDFFFVKEIDILNGSTPDKPLLEVAPSLALQFFPEGGNFLSGVENRLAFKALDERGKGVAVEGEVLDENNIVVASLKSEHDGMGLVRITPLNAQKQYKARLKIPADVDGLFPLPELTPRGYILRVTEEGDNIRIIAYTNARNFSTEPCFVYLVAQSRGIVTFAARGEITGTTLTKILPKRQFPTGVTQITLFDAAQEPQCERLIFVNHQDALKLSVRPDKSTYAKRSKAALDIMVTDKDGAPVAGNFSLSIYDDTKIRAQDEYPMSITNYLLLTSDLAGTVISPGYYLKDELPETRRHRDLLMMTHGWRRFTWQTVLKDPVWASSFYTEHGIVVSGKVLRSLGKKPAIGSKIKVLTTLGDIIILEADSLGRFYSDRLQYYDSVGMVIQTDNAKGKQTELQLFLDPFNPSPALKHNPSPFHTFEADAFLTQAGRQNRITDALDGKATMLKEVEITSTKIEEQRHTIYGTPDVTLKIDDSMLSYSNIFHAIQGRVAGVMISGTPPDLSISIRGARGNPLLLVDGVPMDLDMVYSLSPNDVESVDVIKGATAAIFGSRGANGVIAINTKNGISQSVQTVGIHHLKYPGYYKAREFYVPKYDTPSDNHNLPDLRSTLYWNPSIKTDSTGRAHVSFFTSDVLSSYRIVLEGISHDGTLGHGEGKMKVN